MPLTRPPRWRRSTKWLDVAGHLRRLCSSLQSIVISCDLSDVSVKLLYFLVWVAVAASESTLHIGARAELALVTQLLLG